MNMMQIKVNVDMSIVLVLLIILDNAIGVLPITEPVCWYKPDGGVSYCYNTTELDNNLLGDYVTVQTNVVTIFNVSSSDVIDFNRRCEYNWFDNNNNNRSDKCFEEITIPIRNETEYMVCRNEDIQSNLDPIGCYFMSTSAYCYYIYPSTNRLLHQSIPPTVYVSGIVSNLLILSVLNYKAQKSETNLLLKLLSVWDLLYLVSMLVESCIGHFTNQLLIKDVSYAWAYIKCHWFDSTCIRWDWDESDTNMRISSWGYYIMYWVHLAALVFQIASVYQTVVIATFRCIAIRRPFQASQLLTYRKAAVASACCFLLGVILHLPSFLAAVSLPVAMKCESEYSTIEIYQQCKSDFRFNTSNPLFALSDTAFFNFLHIYHIILYTIILFLALPFVLLLVLNILLLKELYTYSDTPHDEENKAVTKVVITIVSIFLITYIIKPAFTIDIYYFNGNVMNSIGFLSCGRYFAISILVIILPTLNSVVNLLVYLSFRKTFRQQFVDMLSLRSSENREITEMVELQQI